MREALKIRIFILMEKVGDVNLIGMSRPVIQWLSLSRLVYLWLIEDKQGQCALLMRPITTVVVVTFPEPAII